MRVKYIDGNPIQCTGLTWAEPNPSCIGISTDDLVMLEHGPEHIEVYCIKCHEMKFGASHHDPVEKISGRFYYLDDAIEMLRRVRQDFVLRNSEAPDAANWIKAVEGIDLTLEQFGGNRGRR